MSDSQSTIDLDARIEKLEEKLNHLLDTVKKTQATAQETAQVPEPTQITQEYFSHTTQEQTPSGARMSRQEILAEYEKGYLARLEENAIAQEEIRRAAEELKAKNNVSKPNPTRGSLPKGF
jgi:vacuolar-type H+-ATPase subunit I/STV1